jgi:hypothetical protein
MTGKASCTETIGTNESTLRAAKPRRVKSTLTGVGGDRHILFGFLMFC